MKDSEFYICKYCYQEFTPKRRRVQKFCSNTCRSKAHHARKTKKVSGITKSEKLSVPDNIPAPKKEGMSMAGVGNAATGTLAAQALTKLFTKESNKPATKGDLIQLVEKLNGRYHLITNMNPNFKGEYPYFDLVDGILIYIKTM
ncbi:hypothetical protein [Psychroserpens sp. Hel_I_66]|uniref:hypothetical protein n=1 Tax=Psychroserpens sp. Hel_I_66 TaxID=1250004 RepID=UPI000648018E|nr:hypothetical protein [Psychroserpens sp. Hel_I_66]